MSLLLSIGIGIIAIIGTSYYHQHRHQPQQQQQRYPSIVTTTATSTMSDVSAKKMKHVLINIAMEEEAKPFIEHLQLEPMIDFYPPHVPFLAYSGLYHPPAAADSSDGDTTSSTSNTIKVTVITNGKDTTAYQTNVCNVGTIAAATNTMLTMQLYTAAAANTVSASDSNKYGTVIPDVYINAGTAGGFQRNGAKVGTIYVVESFVFHDRRIPIPGYTTYGIGKSNVSLQVAPLLQHFQSSNSSSSSPDVPTEIDQNHHVWKSGICTTGDSLDKTDVCDVIMKENNATVKDMEGAAIAWVMTMFPHIKFGSIKVVTDIVDGPIATQEEFLSNLHVASQQLQYALPTLLEYIATTNTDEL